MIKQKIKKMIANYKTQGFPEKETIRKQIVFFHSSRLLTSNDKFELFKLLNE